MWCPGGLFLSWVVNGFMRCCRPSSGRGDLFVICSKASVQSYVPLYQRAYSQGATVSEQASPGKASYRFQGPIPSKETRNRKQDIIRKR